MIETNNYIKILEKNKLDNPDNSKIGDEIDEINMQNILIRRKINIFNKKIKDNVENINIQKFIFI